jgi:glycosyltransferase involved in cell wall biosynthesis
MISGLIPVFNADVRLLVSTLAGQLEATGVFFEICCVDDGSKPEIAQLNAEITQIKGVRYEILPRNMGRARIREYLASGASYEKLLFLDCDVEINRPDFIDAYLAAADAPVVIGGIVYQRHLPLPNQMLRWKYGNEREQLMPDERSKRQVFLASNLFISKSIFLSNKSNTLLLGYGHEDTLFGLQLRNKNIPITQIFNPVLHAGLDTNAEFLDKTDNALANLARLVLDGCIAPDDLRLLRIYFAMKKTGLMLLLRTKRTYLEKRLLKNLKSAQPDLRKFDLWRLMRLDSYLWANRP